MTVTNHITAAKFLQLLALVSAIEISLFVYVEGYSYFRSRIPNADHVRDPCRVGEVWRGLGHMTAEGGGPRNPFGRDFKLHGQLWSQKLCQADSDGDGRSNGEELGDPYCQWTPEEGLFEEQRHQVSITHPGICEPMDSSECKAVNSWLSCANPANCPDLQHPDVQTLELRLDSTPVPANETTTYMCQVFSLAELIGTDDAVYVIGMEGVINNTDLVHHIGTYSCKGHTTSRVKSSYSSPQVCTDRGAASFCKQALLDWNVGNPMDCYPSGSGGNYGIRLGADGHQLLMIEVHWNNAGLRSNMIDSSGIRLYYTRTPRQYSSGTLFIGAPYLELPPGRKAFSQMGGCSAHCTKNVFKKTFYIPKVLPHMHHMGRAMSFIQKRNGEVIRELYDVTDYNFKTPNFIEFDPPVEVLPGDELKTVCVFNTTGRENYVYYEAGSTDEMCLAIVTYYPELRYGLSFCQTVNDVGICDKYYSPPGCVQHFNEVKDTIADKLSDVCDKNGLVCLPECERAIRAYTRGHPCFTPGYEFYVKSRLISELKDKGKEIVQMLGSCSNNNILRVNTNNSFDDSSMSKNGLYRFLHRSHAHLHSTTAASHLSTSAAARTATSSKTTIYYCTVSWSFCFIILLYCIVSVEFVN